jgi:hypothetical protein
VPRANVPPQNSPAPVNNPNALPKNQEPQPKEDKSWIEAIPQDNDQKTDGSADETPQDWLKPKIFKGNGFV